MTEPSGPKGSGTTRRGLLTGALGGALGLAAGAGAATVIGARPPVAPTAPASIVIAAAGDQQAGIRRPAEPQRFGLLQVLDLPSTQLDWLAAIGERITELTMGPPADLLPDGVGDLTVTVGLGPRIISAIDPSLPGATELPAFAGDERIDPQAVGGDVLIAVYSSDPTVLGAVVDHLAGLVPGATARWRQFVFRGKGSGTKARNPLGFMDGIVVPHDSAGFDEGVWIGDGPLAGGSILVIRRLRLETARFRGLAVDAREAVFGRRLSDGAPLSGGKPDDQVDLRKKTPEGEFVVPADSHARAAHPSFTGSPLMFRRSYSFENDGAAGTDGGLVFMSFQNELRTFVATQQRLDEVDALMPFTSPTASATFVVLPGFTDSRPLGASLL